MWHDGAGPAPTIRSPTSDGVIAFFESGFGAEATDSCRVILDANRLGDLTVFRHSRSFQIMIEFYGDEHGGGEHISASGAFAYMSFDATTRLADLPVDIPGSWDAFTSRPEVSEATAHQCWLRAGSARVINVNGYVNLRRQPGFSAAIVRRVPLGERLQLVGSGNARGVGSASQRQSCQNACQALGRNPGDHAAQTRARQCVDDNVIWYEVIDARGNRGWLSRRFLQQEG